MISISDYSLLNHNTFGMNVKAKHFVEYSSVVELKDFLKENIIDKKNTLHIGGGSNLLFTKDYNGLIFHSAIKEYHVISESDTDVLVRVGAGVVWDDFVEYANNKGWYGIENLSYIPGEVGASAVQNIGAYGVEVKDSIYIIETIAVNGAYDRIFTNEECQYAYRESIFKKQLKSDYIITYVTFRLSKLPKFHLDYGNIRSEFEKNNVEVTLRNIRDIIIKIRKAKLPEPSVQGNAGSFFMNPVVSKEKFESIFELYPSIPHFIINDNKFKIPAAWLIDQCGWKGKKLGNAGVNAMQPLVLVNCGGAEAAEIINLASAIQKSVFEKFGINISPEVNYI